MKSDLEIAREAHLDPIEKVAARAGIDEKYLEPYGRGVAKVDLDVVTHNRDHSCGLPRLLVRAKRPPLLV